jgi:hypothetical protein
MKRWLLALALAVAVSACDRDPEPPSGDPVKSAEFGILFGGQVQDRSAIPLQLDRSKQSQGFRIELSRPLPEDIAVKWEITRPSGARRGPKRVTELGSATLRAGQRTFEARVDFEPGNPLGLWNARVVMGDRVLIDRPFEVYDPTRRPPSDAGPTIP